VKLNYADLTGATLTGANLTGAQLNWAKGIKTETAEPGSA